MAESDVLSVVVQELNFPRNYCRTTALIDTVECYINAPWIRGVIRDEVFSGMSVHETLSTTEVQSALQLGESIGHLWQRVNVQVLGKVECSVYPLARNTRGSSGPISDVCYSQLLHYVATSNNKNLWKDAYKKYSDHGVALGFRENPHIGLESYNNVLREVLRRLYGCVHIHLGKSRGAGSSYSYTGGRSSHANILPAMVILESTDHFLVVTENVKHNLRDCLMFSPAKLSDSEVRPLFLLYQILEAARDTHDRGLHLGDVSTQHSFLDNSLFLHLTPNITQSLMAPQKNTNNGEMSIGNNKKKQEFDGEVNIDYGFGSCRSCGGDGCEGSSTHNKTALGYHNLINSQEALDILKKSSDVVSEKVVFAAFQDSSLVQLTQLWVGNQLSTLDYLLCLNFLSGRVFSCPNHHPILPWVIDFSHRNAGWRDLSRTKFRLTKGDQQLDHTYQLGQQAGQVAHHVTEVFSEITYYVYKVRVTSKELLTKYVRAQWVPEHYPSTMSRLYQWTPDECIPEFYTDPEIFKSIHEDLPDLGVPSWCGDVEDFLSQHRAALESDHVSRKLHHWIDLNFGYKLSGSAAIKAKNVCLELVDGHSSLSSGGVVQLFSSQHPQRLIPSLYMGRSPPKFSLTSAIETKYERNEDSNEVDGTTASAEQCNHDDDAESVRSLSLSRKISRSRTSLADFERVDYPTIVLPQDYNPLVALNQVEMLFNLSLKSSRMVPDNLIRPKDVQMAVKQAAHLRRVRDMQALGCLMLEMFCPSKYRNLGAQASLLQRYSQAQRILLHDQNDVPRCIRRALKVIFQMEDKKEEIQRGSLPCKYEPVSSVGLPPPSPHQLLQPLINVVVFPAYFPKLYTSIKQMKEYSQLIREAKFVKGDGVQHKEFICKLSEIRVKSAAKELPDLLQNVTSEGLELALPYLLELFECSHSAVCASWYLTGPLAKALGPVQAAVHLLPPLVKLMEAQVLTDKHLKLFHRSFLLMLTVRFGLQTFLNQFITALIEGVGGYKEVVGQRREHNCVRRKQSTTLKSVSMSLVGEVGCMASPCEEDSHSSGAELTLRTTPGPGDWEDGGHIDDNSHQGPEQTDGETRFSFNQESTDLTDAEPEPEMFVFECVEEEVCPTTASEASPTTPSTPMQEDLKSPTGSSTLSLDEVSLLQDGLGGGSIPSLCPSPHSPHSLSGEDTPPSSEPDHSITSLAGTPLAEAYGCTSNINIPAGVQHSLYSTSLPDIRMAQDQQPYLPADQFREAPFDKTNSTKNKSHNHTDSKTENKNKVEVDHSLSDVCCESVLWLADRLGPVLTSRYLTRNLLRMLTLCYLPDSGALTPIPPNPQDQLSVTLKRISGDVYAAKVLQCLGEIACLYGEQVILLQYLCHICELVGSCRRKLSPTLEGGLLGALALLHHILTLLTDNTFMEVLQETLIRGAIYPVIRLLSSTKVVFPHGGSARGVLAYRVVDCLFIMALRVGREMSKTLLTPTITRFMTAFDKVHPECGQPMGCSPHSLGGEGDEVLSSSGGDYSGGSPGAALAPGSPTHQSIPPPSTAQAIKAQALEELKQVLTPELAYLSYVPLCRFLGATYMEGTLPNHNLLRSLCLQYDESLESDRVAHLTEDILGLSTGSSDESRRLSARSNASNDDNPSHATAAPNTNVALTGNRIDINDATDTQVTPTSEVPSSIGFASSVNISKFTGGKMDSNQRHLRGNWLAYWEHEIGRSPQDDRFNFKQIKLQTFSGHNNSVKSIHVLDNENSFLSCSKDKTVKLWSLRSQGDGSSHVSAQWTYTGHKKSVFGVTFSDTMRLAASCDSTVHVWDPFICAPVKQLDSLRDSPVTVLAAMAAPSTQLVAATTDATLKFIDLRTCSYTHEFKVSTGGAGLVRSIACSGDGRLVTVAHSSGVISVLDTRTGQLLTTWKPHEGEVLCVVWQKGGTFISSALDQTVAVWSVDDAKLKFTLRGPTEPVHLISLYGEEVITGTTANRIGVHTSVSPVSSFSSVRLRSDAFRGVLTTMAVLPLNRLLLCGADNGTIRLLC